MCVVVWVYLCARSVCGCVYSVCAVRAQCVRRLCVCSVYSACAVTWVPCAVLYYSSVCPDFAPDKMCRDCGQAIAALAYGIGKVPAVDVIVGPGNKWVTAAKSIVSGHVGIDMLAGPSECLVLADHTADAAVIAADLLAQAEHDTEAIPILGQACPALPQGFAAVAVASCVLRWPCRGRTHR